MSIRLMKYSSKDTKIRLDLVECYDRGSRKKCFRGLESWLLWPLHSMGFHDISVLSNRDTL